MFTLSKIVYGYSANLTKNANGIFHINEKKKTPKNYMEPKEKKKQANLSIQCKAE